MTKNRVCFWEINAKDGPALAEFYTRLFGWKSRYDEKSDFFDFDTGGDQAGGINGGIFTGKGRLPTHRCLYVEVEDIDIACKKARELGREILQGPFEVDRVGYLAFFTDPEGHMIGLIQRTET
jgi:predicted enzyme related to lactoylglutathione lyase